MDARFHRREVINVASSDGITKIFSEIFSLEVGSPHLKAPMSLCYVITGNVFHIFA